MTSTSLERSYQEVRRLIADFAEHLPTYLSPEYSEAQARYDFIDKFLTALGWDVSHNIQKNPLEQEVKVENRVNTEHSQRRADYAFFAAPNFRDVRFYVEAKKPTANLDSADHYFQTIRYGWNSSTPLALLTDFHNFHVMDCRYKPHIDTVSERVVARYRCSEFESEEKFAEIYFLFSREAVHQGALERAAASLPKRRGPAVQRGLFKGGYQSIDDAFLQDLDSHRDELARSLKNRNAWLEGPELTEITQRVLDRLVFLRFLEDKLIESREGVAKFGARGSVWGDFVAASHRLDTTYNGAVFKHHALIDGGKLEVDDLVFGGICEDLADVNSPYNFDVIPIHILGSIYERFLGRIIVTTEKRARVEDKPEVRKAGGVYYTPEYIVRKIVADTVGVQIEGKSPQQIAEMSFADIACGSGSFLLGVYDCLLHYHTVWYNANKDKVRPAECALREDGAFHLTLRKKRDILLRNIYGVDIDSQAVEVAQLSLYLKLLEDETPASARQFQLELAIREALLPSLTRNIVCGNSLVEPDPVGGDMFGTPEDIRLNPFDPKRAFVDVFRRGGFDSLVGNPPYDVMEKERGAASWPHDKLAEYARAREEYHPALGGKLNLFRFFVVRMIQLAREGGRIGVIVPLALLGDISCAATRKHVMVTLDELVAHCFPQKDNPMKRVFREAKISTVVLTGRKRKKQSEARAGVHMRVFPWSAFDDTPREAHIAYRDAALLDPENVPIPLVSERQWELCRKLHTVEGSTPLRDMKGVVVRRGEINQTIYREFISQRDTHARLLKGVEVGRYGINKVLSQGVREWFDEKRFLRSNQPRQIAGERRIATQRITGVDEKSRIVATIVEPPCYFADSTNSIGLSEGAQYPLEVILALLNSKLYQWRFRLTSTNNNVGTNELEAMPFPDVQSRDVKKGSQWSRRVEAIVKGLMAARVSLDDARTQKECDYINRRAVDSEEQLNELVYEAFQLTTEEIGLVETEWGGAARGHAAVS